MTTAWYGGLTGKSRTNWKRDRAEKSLQDQWIAESLGPRADERARDRYIPIRRMRKFLPQIASSDQDAPGTETLLESATPVMGEDRRSFGRRIVWPPDQAGPLKTDRLLRTSHKKSDRAIRLTPGTRHDRPDSSKSGQTIAPSPQRRRTLTFPETRPTAQRSAHRGPGFTLSGFVGGCLMGGAAAAVILVALNALLR
ncbi:MAG: hypothetical protein IID38_05485 [Planctomycetes bacterium]|nr:hypothetical protein [Planctomycetota bacterium]